MSSYTWTICERFSFLTIKLEVMGSQLGRTHFWALSRLLKTEVFSSDILSAILFFTVWKIHWVFFSQNYNRSFIEEVVPVVYSQTNKQKVDLNGPTNKSRNYSLNTIRGRSGASPGRAAPAAPVASAAPAAPGAAAHHPLHAQDLISRLANLKMMCQPKFDLSEKIFGPWGGWRHWIVVILIL